MEFNKIIPFRVLKQVTSLKESLAGNPKLLSETCAFGLKVNDDFFKQDRENKIGNYDLRYFD